jgi:cytidine deaminase
MHCDICDRDHESVTFDASKREFTPCNVCQEVIDETLAEFEDQDEET